MRDKSLVATSAAEPWATYAAGRAGYFTGDITIVMRFP